MTPSENLDFQVNCVLRQLIVTVKSNLPNESCVNSLETLETLDTAIRNISRVTERHLDKMGKRGWVYLAWYDSEYYKIGHTNNLKQRLYQLKNEKGNYHEIEYIHFIETDDMERLEFQLHEQYADKSVGREMFYLDPEDILNFRVLGSCFYGEQYPRMMDLFK